jgi:hypothetical protein
MTQFELSLITNTIANCLSEEEQRTFFEDLKAHGGVVDATVTINGRTLPLSFFVGHLEVCFDAVVQERADEMVDARLAELTDEFRELIHKKFTR